jgi:hypothetical protein
VQFAERKSAEIAKNRGRNFLGSTLTLNWTEDRLVQPAAAAAAAVAQVTPAAEVTEGAVTAASPFAQGMRVYLYCSSKWWWSVAVFLRKCSVTVVH